MSNIKKLAILFFILSVCIYNLHAAVWFQEPATKKVCKRGKCVEYCALNDYFLQPGESFKTDKCTEIFCNLDFSSRGESCGVAVMDGCKLSPDFTKKYPECCNKICLDED